MATKKLGLRLAVCFILAFTVGARAATYTWINLSGGNWSAAANWSGGPVGTVPGGTDTALITTTGNYTVTVNNNQSVGALTLGASSGDGTLQTLNLSGGTFTVTGASSGTAQGIFSVTGGVLGGAGMLTLAGPLNWSGGSVGTDSPGLGNVTFNGGSFSGASQLALNGGQLINTGTLAWSDSALGWGNGGQFINEPNATINLTGNLNPVNFGGIGVTVSNAGNFNVSVSGTAIINEAFNNTGTVTISSGTFDLIGGGTDSDTAGGFDILSGATLQLGNSYTLTAASTIGGAGNFMVTSGTANVQGALNCGGTWTFNGGTANLSGTTTASGNAIVVENGTVNFSGTGPWQPATLTVSNGTLGGTAPVSVSSAGGFDWTGGTLGNSTPNTGIVEVNGGNLSGNNGLGLNGGQLINSGTLGWSAPSLGWGNGGRIVNNASGTINLTANLSEGNYGGAAVTVSNAGNFNVSVSGTATISQPFDNTGTVTLSSGTLNLNGGGTDSDTVGGFDILSGTTLQFGNSYTFNASSLITGAGNFLVTGGTVNMSGSLNASGTWTFDGGTANLTGTTTTSGNAIAVENGTVNFSGTGPWQPGTLTVSDGTLGGTTPVSVLSAGGFNWTAGTLGNAAPNTGIVEANGGSLSTANGLALNGGQVINSGTLAWSNPSLSWGNGGQIINNLNGTINLTANIDPGNFGGVGVTVSNAGNFNVSVSGTATITQPFNNTGTVTVSTGTLDLDGGGTDSDTAGGIDVLAGATLQLGNTYTFNPSSTITGAGNFLVTGGTINLSCALNLGGNWTFNGGTANLNGVTTVSGNAVALENGTVNFNGTGPWQPGTLSITSGTLGGTTPVFVLSSGGFSWTGGTMGNAAPNTGIVHLNGGSVSGNNGLGLNGGQVINSGTLAWSDASLSWGNGAQIINSLGGTLNLTANIGPGNYGGAGVTVSNAGNFNVSVSTTATVTGTFNNTGTVTINNGTLSLTGGGTDSDTAGGMAISSGADLNIGNNYTFVTGSAITGAGSFSVSGGTVNINGALSVTGPWTFSGGIANLGGTTSTSGNSVTINGGTANFSGTGPWQPATLALSAGVLGGTTPVSVMSAGGFTWTGGTMGNATPNTGIVEVNGGSLSSGNGLGLNGGQLINSGALTWADPNITWGNGAQIVNTSVGTINVTASIGNEGNYGGAAVTVSNAGQFNVNIPGSATFNEIFNNTGTVTVNGGTFNPTGSGTETGSFVTGANGTLLFSGGTYNFSGSASISGSGACDFSGSTVNFSGSSYAVSGTINLSAGTWSANGTGTITPTTFNLSGGTLLGSDPVLVGGAFTWSGGSIGNGLVNGGIVSFGNGTFSGGATLSLNGGLLTNTGTLAWADPSMNWGNGGVIINTPAGTINVTANINQGNFGGAATTVSNAGQFNINVPGTATINQTFNNTGTVTVNGGTLNLPGSGTETGSFVTGANGVLSFSSGTYNFSGNASISGSGVCGFSGSVMDFSGASYAVGGAIDLSGGVWNANGAGTITPTTFNLSGGTLLGSNPVLASGAFTWSGGNIGNSPGSGGIVSFAGGAFSGGTTLSLDGGLLTNTATLAWANPNMNWGNGAQIVNTPAGTINVTASIGNEGNYGGTTTTVSNAGHFNVNVPGTATINAPFNNGGAGTVAVNAGTLSLTGGGTDSDSGGGFNLASGATLNLGNSYTFNSGSTITGPGNLSVGGGTANFNGTVSATGTYTIAGTANFNGTASATPSTVNLTGTLNGTMPILDSGPLNWTAGTITGVIYCVGGTVNDPNGIDGGQIINSGIMSWIPYPYTGNGSVISNAASGIINVTVNGRAVTGINFGNPATFYNAGTMNFAGTGEDSIADLFINTGTVNITSGTFGIGGGGTNSGTINVASAGTFNPNNGTLTNTPTSLITGAGNLNVSGGTANFGGPLNLTGTWNFSAGTANLTGSSSANGYTVNVSGTVNFNGTGSGGVWTPGSVSVSGGVLAGTTPLQVSGPLNWSSGNITGVIYCNGGLVNNPGGLYGGQIINSGVLTWIPYPYTGGGSVISNASTGVINVTVNGRPVETLNASGGGTFYNAGQMNFAGSGTASMDDTFINTGTVTVSNGTFALTGGRTLTGGTLNFGIGSLTSYGQMSLSGAADLSGTLSATLENGFVPSIGNSWEILTYGSSNGVFAVTNLPTAAVWHTTATGNATTAGGITVGVESLVPIADYANVVSNTPNLLGYWRFDPVFQTNSCVNGYLGMLQGNAQLGTPGTGPALASEPPEQSLELDGVNSYLSTTLSGGITNQGTFLVWVYLTAQPSTDGHTFEIITQSQSGNDFSLQIQTDNNVYFFTDSGSSTVYPQALPLNQWHFLAATFVANSTRNIYLDGQLVATSTAGSHSVNNSDIWIGNDPVFGPRMFQGRIAEAAVFSRALSATEVSEVYSAALSAPGLDITANNTSMVYGGTVPGLSVTYSGYASSDAPATPGGQPPSVTTPPTVTTTATSTSPVGTYPITASGAVDPNYSISYFPGTLTITKPTLTITANSTSKSYGQTVTFAGTEFTVSGLAAGDSVASVMLTSAGAAPGAGVGGSPYSIVPSAALGSGLGNYNIFYVNGNLTVTQATPLITWANPASILYPAPLSATQLDATANIAGTFVYTPPGGTVLLGGNGQPLSVVFTPTDSVDYTTANDSVAINILTCYPAPSGLTDWWQAEGNVLDAIGGDNGTINGGVTYVRGEVGQAFSFDGSTGWVDIPNTASLNPTGPFSVEFWMNANPTQTGAQFLVVDKSHGFTDSDGWVFQGTTAGGALSFGYGIGGAGPPVNFITANTVGSVLDGQWHHVAGVYDGTQVSLYLDGALQNSTPAAQPPVNNTRDMEIGSSWGGGARTRYFGGMVDEVSYYDRALSQTEIQGIFAAGSAGKCPPAVAIAWPNPANITYGTALGAVQLNASANVAGTFAYTPAAGAILPAGSSQTLSVTFTPEDAADFAPVTQTAAINVQQLPLTITANNASKTYGQTVSLPATAFVAGALINGDTVTGVTLTSAGAAATAGVAGSPYSIVPSAATGTGVNNYNINYVNGNLTVSPATLVITANNINKVYRQQVTFAGTEFQAAGLQNGDTVGSVTLTSAGAGATAPLNGSPYPIVTGAATGGTFSPVNYNISYANGQLFVAPAPLTITANSTSKNYGQGVSFAGTEFTTSGLLGGDTVSSVTLTSDGASATGSAGTHNIVPSLAVGTDLANYSITYANGTLTVLPVALTITANSLAKTYGQTENFNGTEFTSVGLLNSDSISTVRLNSTGTAASAGVAVYQLVPSSAFGSGLNNYTIGYVNGTLTVNPAPLTVTANNLTMTQDGTVPTLTVSYSGFVNNDGPSSLNGSPSLTTTATSGSSLGAYPISVMLGTINDPNYTYNFVDGTLTVQQTTLYITATDASMTYGGTVPALSVSYSGFINGDTPASLTTQPSVTTTGSSTAHAGTWPTTASGAVDPNYTIVYVPGTLTINPAPLTITANSTGKSYGQTVSFAGTEFTAAPLLNGDTIASVTLSSTGAATTAGAGSYPIVASAATGPRAGNYDIAYVNGTLTVNPANLLIEAVNETKYFGQTFPFTGSQFTTSGLQNGDTVGSVTLTSPGTPATASVVGSPYLITPSAATGGTFVPANYNIAYVQANLNVLPVGNAPAITAVLPSAGPVAGGSSVTIVGSSFESGAIVLFGGVPATGVQVQNSATIVATTPALPSGAVNVTVNNPDGTGFTALNAYSYGNPPVISSSPAGLTLNQSQTAQFQVAASGDPTLTYQWQYNGANLLETTHTSGTHTTALTVNNVTGGDIGNYRCVVSNPFETVPSATAGLNVIVPPTTVAVSPPGASVGPGGSVTLTASANGTSPAFSWYQGNTLLAGQNGVTLTLANIQSGATYTAVAQNAAGSATSAPVVISVLTYCANVQVAQATYPEGTQFIPLTVQTLNCANNSVMPNSGAVLWIYTLGTSRALPVTTDASGNGTVEFTPLPVETGLCQFAVALPGQSAPPPTGSFTIIGMNLSQQSESPQLIVGVPQTNTLLLNNLTGVPLTGLRATILEGPSDVNITVSVPDSVPGNGAVQTTYTLAATGTSPSSATFAIQFTSTEGASVILPFSATMSPLTAQLSVIPGSLVGTMIEGGQTLVPFIVTNSGGAASGPLTINAPSVAWLSVVTAQPIASLAPNQSAQILLALQPTNGQQLGVYPGTIVVQGTNTSVTLPFNFTAVSTLVGNLQVTVEDELSIFGAGNPNLAGATVTVNDFLSGATIATQVTDASGIVTFNGLTSAYYTVNVQAPNHGSFSTTLLVAANTTTPVIAFLPLQLVDYTWTVTPTVIPDTYDFTLTTVFVTEVPWPVITVSPGSIDLCGIVGNSVQIDLVITNSGLIAGEGLQLAVDESNPDWSIVPLSTNLGNLEAESSIVVPVTLTRIGTSTDASVPSIIAAAVNWYVAALNQTEYNSTPIFIYNANPINCDPAVGSSTPVVPTGGGGTNGGTVFVGQQGFGNSPGGTPTQPVISQPSYNFPPPTSGAVVAVTLQIDQSAVISQNAFHATLNLNNNAGAVVTDLQVQINPVDANGNPAGSQFFIQPPLLTGINAVDGTGTLAVGANAQANWTIIPTTTAAANGTTNYAIGGTLSYNLNGQPVSIPLFAVPITVLPDPELDLDYFLQHDVYSQDPFTTVVEPPQPFALGLRVRNDGLGIANNFTITSAEPTIINNANGLLINFQLLSSEVGTNSTPVPSFTLDMGNINPGTNVVGIWFMTASLEGDFTNFQASFQHSDALGGTETSVVNSVRIHEMNHVVRITCPDDDFIPDFLCNDTTNVDALPDDVYSSDGNVYPVTSLTGAAAQAAVTITSPIVTINDTADIIPGGFVYFELPDPSDGQFTITSVTRSDGKQLLVGPNVWQTPIRPHMVPPHLTNLVHIFDCDSTGKYIINYGSPVALSWTPPAPITYGTALGPTQLNATATIPGAYNYNPPAGTILTPGTQTLSLTFTPTDTSFSIINSNVTVTVLPAPLTIAANNNLTKVYGQTETFAGTEFTATGLINGNTVTSVTLTSSGAPMTAPVVSSPYYSVVPSAAVGTGLGNYAITYVNGSLAVTPAPLTVTAASTSRPFGAPNPTFTATFSGFVNNDPPSVVGGTAGFSTSAMAASPVGPYNIVPSAGTLTAVNYQFGPFVNGTLTVTPATPIVTWSNPAAISIGTPLGSTQLDATDNVPGTFVYTPPAGTILPGGDGQVLSVVFTPSDSTDYTTAGATAHIDVSGCDTAPSGLVSWWKGDGNTFDVVGGNAGVLENGVTYVTGEVGQAFNFDANSAMVVVGNPANLQLQDFSIEAWVRRGSATSVTSDPSAGSATLFGYGSGGYAFGLTAGGALFLGQEDASSVASTASLNDTEFHHVAVTKSGTTVVFYVDGVAAPAGAFSATFQFTTPAAIGGRADNLNANNNDSFLGVIDELAVYNRALTSAEVSGIYEAGAGGKCLPTVTVTWPNPADITYGAPLTGTQLDATANLAGSFIYTPAAGTILPAGAAQTLSVTFTPADTVDYPNPVVQTAAINVQAAALTITANNNFTKVYGQTKTFAGTEFTTSGLVNGDTVTSVTLTSAGAPATALVAGSPYLVVPSNPVGTGLGNYTISYVDGSLAVTLAPLTVAANNASRAFGDPNPVFTGTITGLQNSDNITATYSTTATPTSPTGTYLILPQLVDPSGALANYSATTNIGTLTVTAGYISLLCQQDIMVNYNSAICGQLVPFNPVAMGDPAPTLTCTLNGVPITSPYVFPVGTNTVVCTATSPVGTDTCSFHVIVVDPNLPIAGPNTLGTYENTGTVEQTAKILLRDSSPLHLPLSILSVTSPTPEGATVTLGNGQLFYTPAASYVGLDTLTYTLSDGCGTAPGMVLVTVLATNLPTQNLESIFVSGAGRTVVFNGIPGANYEIEWAPAATGPWTVLSGAIMAATNGLVQYTDTTSPIPTVRFYRTKYISGP